MPRQNRMRIERPTRIMRMDSHIKPMRNIFTWWRRIPRWKKRTLNRKYNKTIENVVMYKLQEITMYLSFLVFVVNRERANETKNDEENKFVLGEKKKKRIILRLTWFLYACGDAWFRFRDVHDLLPTNVLNCRRRANVRRKQRRMIDFCVLFVSFAGATFVIFLALGFTWIECQKWPTKIKEKLKK